MKFLLIFVILTGIACAAQSQTTVNNSDTMCFPVEVLQNLLIAARQGTVMEQRVAKLNEDLANCLRATTELQQSEAAMQVRDNAQTAIINEQSAQVSILKVEVEKRDKKIRRLKVTTKVVAVLGLALSTA